MAKIIAARLERATDADAVLQSLSSQGFRQSEFQFFYVNPKGQHALYPVGGDASSDEGSRRAGRGTIYGVLIGACAGLGIGFAAGAVFEIPLLALGGLAAGAYGGSLIGALNRLKDGDKRKATAEHPVERPAGQMVAIRVDRPGTEPSAMATLTRYGAHDIEHTDGEWRDGDWKDFDPRLPARR